MYDNEFETKDEVEPQHIYSYFHIAGWCPQSGEEKDIIVCADTVI